MFFKNLLKDYFSFGKRDRIGIMAVIILIAVIYALPYLFAKEPDTFPVKQGSILVNAMDTLAATQKNNPGVYQEENNSYQYEPSQVKSFRNGDLFQFDPNTLSTEGWQKLGLSQRISNTIEKYRNKGGTFYKPEDIKKIWGMPEGFYERVKEYMVIADKQNKHNANNFQKPAFEKTEKKLFIVDINEADTAAFIALPGIGSKLAARIVNFRDKLGGFYSLAQVGETYGVPDSTFQKIKTHLILKEGAVKKLNINTATKDELKVHPYIKWNLANAIVEYRNQHGAYKSLEDLKNIVMVDEATFNKISHYLNL